MTCALPTFWTAYRRYYVRECLGRGLSIAAIAERLGVRPASVRRAILKYGLREPEAAHG